MFRPWSQSVDMKRKVSAESVDARSVCRGPDHSFMFCSSNTFTCGWHCTQKTAAYSCSQPERWPMHKWALPDCLSTQFTSFVSCPSPLPLHWWDRKRGVKHRQQAIEQDNNVLGLVHKSWGWGGNEEVTGSQHSTCLSWPVCLSASFLVEWLFLFKMMVVLVVFQTVVFP